MKQKKSFEKSSGPNAWCKTTLGELTSAPDCFIQTGPFGSQLHKHDYQDRGIGVVNPTHMLGNKIIHDDVPRVGVETAARLERHRLSTGDILFARRGEIGRHGLVTSAEDGWLCGTGCFLVRIRRQDVENQFLSYFISNRETVDWLNRHAAGVVMPNLNNSVLEGLPFRFPPVDEQRKIVAVLGLVQRAVEQQERLLSLTHELKKALLHHLFTHGPHNEPQKQTELGFVPQSWEIVALGSAVEQIDYGISAPIPKNVPKNGVKIISTADITKDGRLLYNQIRRIIAPEKTIRRLVLHAGDVLFNWRNSAELIGKSAVFQEQIEPHVFASFILRIRCGEKKSHNYFITHLMNYFRERGVFVKLARRAVNQANYNRNEISVLNIPLPSYDEQREIAYSIAAIDTKLSLHQRKHAALSALFGTLLHQLMTAQVHLNDLDLGKLVM